MSDALERVNKLIALALNNPNEAEARSAAFAAVKAIRDNHIVLSVQQVSRDYVPPPHHVSHSPMTQSTDADAYNAYSYWWSQQHTPAEPVENTVDETTDPIRDWFRYRYGEIANG